VVKYGKTSQWQCGIPVFFTNIDDYRLFASNLGNEVTGDLLARAFKKYKSLQQTHVVREKRSGRSRGFGFISFSDPEDFVKAVREMNNQYVGNRPIKLRKSTWKDRVGDDENIAFQKDLAKVAKKAIKQ
jgi:RNA recognition motif-containing protein